MIRRQIVVATHRKEAPKARKCNAAVRHYLACGTRFVRRPSAGPIILNTPRPKSISVTGQGGPDPLNCPCKSVMKSENPVIYFLNRGLWG